MNSHNGSVGKVLKESNFLLFGCEIISEGVGDGTQSYGIHDVFARIISLNMLNRKYVM